MAYPVLAAQNTWFAPTVSTVTRASITEIEIMDSYTPDSSVTVVDSWDASAAQDGSITCYVIGTKLIIAGNGSGKIAANEDSYTCFAQFEAMSIFSGANMLDMSGANTMCDMFFKCTALTTIDVSTWDVSKVTNMDYAFMRCFALTSIVGINNWDVSSVTTMRGMFAYLQSMTSIDLSGWDTSNVTNMQTLFYQCVALTSIEGVSELNVSSVTNMVAAFANCEALETIDISMWNVSNAESAIQLFWNCYKLKTPGDLSSWNLSSCTSLQMMFDGCESLLSIGDVSNWDTSNVTTLNRMFQHCSKLIGIGNLANWGVSNVTDMSFMFYSCSSIGEIDVSSWDVSKVTSFDHFAAHAGLRRKGIENWKTSSATNMNALFHNCAEEELDLSGWDVSKVQFFCQMFENSPTLKRIKGLENWNTSAGLGFDGMFERCYVLEELDLSSFDTSKAKNGVEGSTNGHKTATLQNMFLSCNNLRKITLGSNFAVNGDGTNTTAANKLILPTPSTEYLEGADGSWYDFGGMEYAPNAIPDRTANTYYAVYDDVGDVDMIIKNDTLIQIAKAIRTKNGGTDRYQPSEFAAAIEALS